MEQTQLPPWKRHIGYGAIYLIGYAIGLTVVTAVNAIKEIGDPFDVWGEDDDDEFYL